MLDGAGVGVAPGAADGGVFCVAEAGADVGEMVTVRPSLEKLAMTGMVAFTVMTAVPLLSL